MTPNSPIPAILVVRDGARWLPATLDALAASTHPIGPLVVVDGGSQDDSVALIRDWQQRTGVVPELRVVAEGSSRAPGVRRAMDLLDTDESPWAWWIEDDCAPEPDCLATLLAAVADDPRLGIVAPKYLLASDPHRLAEVGRPLTASGRPVPRPRVGEFDQGQYDDRDHVVAVGGGAVLVRTEAYRAAGLDPAFDRAGALSDLCWRLWDLGYGVDVVPAARARHTRATQTGLRGSPPAPQDAVSDTRGATGAGEGRRRITKDRRVWDRRRQTAAARAERVDRRAARRVALTRGQWWQSVLRWPAAVAGSLLLSVVFLVLKRPREAAAELSDIAGVTRPFSGMLARIRWWRRRRAIRAAGGVGAGAAPIATVLAPASAALAGVREEAYAALPDPTPSAESADPTQVAVEPGPVSDPSIEPAPAPGLAAGAAAGLLLLAVTAALTAWIWHPLLDSATWRLGWTGGELVPADGSAAQLWSDWRRGWTSAGTGSATQPPVWTPVVAGAAWLLERLPRAAARADVGVAAAALLVVSTPLAALTAYRAARVATSNPWLRAAGALVWVLLPPFQQGLAHGRLGVAAVQVLAPVVGAGLARAARPPVWWPSVAATVLASALLGAVAPAVLIALALCGLGLAVFGRSGTRAAGLLIAVGPALALGPAALRWVHHPQELLTGPGLSDWAAAPGHPWQTALLWPQPPQPGWPVWITAPLAAAALVALLRVRASGAATWAALGAVLLLALAIVAPRVTIGQWHPAGATALREVTVWSGLPLDLAGLLLIGLALRGADIGDSGMAGRAISALTAVAALAVAAGLAVVAGSAPSALEVPASTIAPAAREGAWSALRTRVLDVEATPGRVTYAVVGRDAGPVARTLPDAGGDEAGLGQVAARLLGTAAPATTTAPALAERAIGSIAVRGEGTATVAARLDITPGLSRMAAPPGTMAWRVLPVTGPQGTGVAASLIRFTDAAGAPVAAVPTQGEGPRVTSAAIPAEAAALVVAEPDGWQQVADVTADGDRLTGAATEHGISYPLPADARTVTVAPVDRWAPWHWAQVAWWVVLALAALPFGLRRERAVRR